MIKEGLPNVDLDEPLRHWRQGDFTFDAGGFLYASLAEGDEHFDAAETTEKIVDLIAVSQTCDIVRRTGGRHFVAVCPLMEVSESELSAIRKGRKPYMTVIENVPETFVADLRRVMSVHKDVVRNWERQNGFSSEAARLRFAAALERKFGQFAFPDKFQEAIKKFRDRVWSRHSKSGSEPGKVYRSLVQIRFCAEPNWTANKPRITVIAILQEKVVREIDRNTISGELDSILGKIKWNERYEWGKPKFKLGTASELTAQDIITSQRGDFDFLCY